MINVTNFWVWQNELFSSTQLFWKIVGKKKFPNLAIDFRLAVYYSLILKKFHIHKSHLTFYRQVEEGMDSKYKKYKSKEWWARRKEAFEFLNHILIKNKLPRNRSLDYFITNLFNKFIKIWIAP